MLDTNALSEPQRPKPDPGYMAWVAAQDEGDLATSAVVYGELKRGALNLPFGTRRVALETWLTEAVASFGHRLLPIDTRVAATWAELSVRHRRGGRTVLITDELIAATALAHGLAVVTRNVRDFQASGCEIVSPWMTQ